MNTKTTGALAFMLMLALMPAATTADETQTPYLAESEIGDPLPPTTDHDTDCGGDLPLEFYCNNGDHERPGAITHGFQAPFPENAVLESRIVHDGGEDRRWTCTYENGASQGCTSAGSWPPTAAGTVYSHECWIYYPDTELGLEYNSLMPSAVPGGEGSWSCYITH